MGRAKVSGVDSVEVRAGASSMRCGCWNTVLAGQHTRLAERGERSGGKNEMNALVQFFSISR
jgi:hypothetical protein